MCLHPSIRNEIRLMSFKEAHEYVGNEVALLRLWLRRLAEHQIYTLDDFIDRGIRLKPTTVELDD